MKRCTKCGEIKEFTEFHKHKGKKDGLATPVKHVVNNSVKQIARKLTNKKDNIEKQTARKY